MKKYRIKYRGYWGNTIGYSTIEAKTIEDAISKVSKWGFILDWVELNAKEKELI